MANNYNYLILNRLLKAPPRLFSYGLAFATSVAALGFVSWLEGTASVLTFQIPLAVVFFNAWYGGWRSGLLSLGLFALGIHFLFIHRQMHAPLFEQWEVPRLGLFLFLGLCFIWVIEKIRSSYIEAKKAVQVQEEVLAVVSHDLRNPLSSILLNANMILKGAPNPQRNAEIIKRTCGKMNFLIEDLLSLAKIEAGKLVLDLKAHLASELLDEVEEIFRSAAESKGIQMRRRSIPTNLSVECDSRRVFQVLSNLVSNAIKFSHRDTVIELGVVDTGNRVIFFVSDMGPGIQEKNIPHLFDRFWQEDSTSKGGTGLGLFISKRIIDAHGGEIWAKSKMGNGSTFYFSLSKTETSLQPKDKIA